MADLANINDSYMHFKEKRLQSFKSWPFDDGQCSAEKVFECGAYTVLTNDLRF